MLSKPKQKIFLSYCTYLLVVAALAGCKFTTDSKESSTSVSNASAVEATKIVGYTNDIIDIMKTYTEAAEDAVEYYDDLKEKVAGTKSYASSPSSMNFLWTKKEAAANAFSDPSTSLGNDRQFFKDSLGLYASLFKTFKEQDSALAIYVKAEDYKDDQFAKGKAIIDKQNEIYTQLVRLRNSIETKIESVADAAEEISLKDSPIRDAYRATKGDFAKFKSLIHLIAEKETFTDTDLATIDTKYTELNTSIETNKNADKARLDKENRTGVYVNYYTTLTEKSAELKTIIRNIKKTKTLTEDDYNTVSNILNQVVNAYNAWVG